MRMGYGIVMPVLRVRQGSRGRFTLSLRPSAWELAGRVVGRWLWGFRREMAVLAGLWLADRVLVGAAGPLVGHAVLLGLVADVLVVGWSRRLVVGWLAGGRVMRRWAAACRACGLVDGADRVPRVRRVVRVRAGVVLAVVVRPGQDVAELAGNAARLAAAMSARSVQVIPDLEYAACARVVVTAREVLATTVPPAPLAQPTQPAAVAVDRVPVGVREDGGGWLLPVRGGHVLIAGATGAGKSTVLWSLIRGLAPAVYAGLVEVWAVDPKGGMELAFGQALFARFGFDVERIADLLDEAVEVMVARAERLRGVSRLHVPTVGDPLIVLIVDEVASLTAYVTDAAMKRRIAGALALLLSQGRAPGVVVVGAVQDPRKDVLPFRDLFPVRVALRMTEPSQVDLVLGDGAYARGAHAERIPHAMAGTGYVLVDGEATPVRVRAAWVDDAEINTVAHAYGLTDRAPTDIDAEMRVDADQDGDGWDVGDGAR
jgi:DNA segregation ATPase FtsK/SpoIIIE, S-DNA-T family